MLASAVRRILEVRPFVLCGLGMLPALIGCGGGSSDGPPVAAVNGVVTLAGAPLPDAIVQFRPIKGPLSLGKTDSNGKFTMRTGSRVGAVVGGGKFMVSVNPPPGQEVRVGPPTPDDLAKMSMDATRNRTTIKEPEQLIPRRYSDPNQSPFDVTIKANQTNEVTLALDPT